MNEKELRKILKQKQKEVAEAEKAYNRIKYDKQISSFADTLGNSPEVLKLIQTEDLNADDCRLLANIIGKKIRPIYKNFSETIMQNQQRRKNKNQTRNERRHREETTRMQPGNPTTNMAVKPATVLPSHTNPQTHGPKAETDGRQY